MEYCQYEPSYLSGLLEAWNQSLTWDPISQGLLCAKVLEDENFDPSLVFLAREGEKIQGFLLAVHRRTPYLDRGLEPELGWITALGVRPEARGQGIAGELLRRAEARLAALGVRTVVLGAYSPHYFLPGIDLEPVSYTHLLRRSLPVTARDRRKTKQGPGTPNEVPGPCPCLMVT